MTHRTSAVKSHELVTEPVVIALNALIRAVNDYEQVGERENGQKICV